MSSTTTARTNSPERYTSGSRVLRGARPWAASALLLAGIAAHAASAHTQVFRCVDANGNVVFSDTGCGSASEKVKVVESSGGLSPIKSDGLSSQDKDRLGAIQAREAQAPSQSAGGGDSPAESPSTPSSSPAPHRSY